MRERRHGMLLLLVVVRSQQLKINDQLSAIIIKEVSFQRCLSGQTKSCWNDQRFSKLLFNRNLYLNRVSELMIFYGQWLSVIDT